MADQQVDDPSFPQVQNSPGALISVPPPDPVGQYQVVVDAAIAAQFGTRLVEPFMAPTPVQTNRLRAYCKINIDGLSGSVDVTSRLNPFLLSVRVRNGIGGVSDYTAEIELDDRDARLPIPPLGAHVTIDMGWISENAYQVFNGTVQDVEHGFARKQGGRRMWIQCKGENHMGKGKDPMQDDTGEGAKSGENEGTPIKILDVLTKAAGNAGHSFQIAPKFASLTRDYVAQANESFYHFGNRIADEIGGFFRVVGGTQAMINAADEMADGVYPTVIAQWGYNLISWKVHPMMARPAWSGSNQQFYDHLEGQWKTLAGKIGMKDPWGAVASVFALPQPAANSGNAEQDNSGQAENIAAGTGPGRIVINGEPRAKGGGYVNLIGARPGVDGMYHIDTAEHLYSREGYVTWLDVYVMTTGTGSTVDGTQYKIASRDNPPLAPPPVTPTGDPGTAGIPGLPGSPSGPAVTPPTSPLSATNTPPITNFPGGPFGNPSTGSIGAGF